MRNTFKQVLGLIVVFMMGFINVSQSQSTYNISNSNELDMKLSGTSTLHKWSMDARIFKGDAKFLISSGNDEQLTALSSLSFSLAVMNLKSGENGLDENAYKSLKTDKFKDIVYRLTSSTVSPDKDNKFLLKTKGNLTIAGVTKEITMDVYCLLNKDGTVTCTGSYTLKMTDYDVKPPTFMLGAMKTGDSITLNFTMVYKKQA